MLQAYRRQYGTRFCYIVPCNLYGPGDNFEERSSHVIPALVKRFHEAYESKAQKVACWGTGNATRSFLYVDDAAKAIALACAGLDDDVPVNLPGAGETRMADLAQRVADLTWFEGSIEWDSSKPDGQPRRLVDGTRAKELLGWSPTTSLDEGLKRTIEWFVGTRTSGAKLPVESSVPTPR
jgi:nucleoside-diphosphate-sugar epimerase